MKKKNAKNFPLNKQYFITSTYNFGSSKKVKYISKFFLCMLLNELQPENVLKK